MTGKRITAAAAALILTAAACSPGEGAPGEAVVLPEVNEAVPGGFYCAGYWMATITINAISADSAIGIGMFDGSMGNMERILREDAVMRAAITGVVNNCTSEGLPALAGALGYPGASELATAGVAVMEILCEAVAKADDGLQCVFEDGDWMLLPGAASRG